jgi:hypothetical protein
MKTIIDNTGKVLYTTAIEVELQDNQTQIDALPTENFVKPYWNFQTMSFYEQATQSEINEIRIPLAIEIDLYYTDLIFDILKKHTNKLIIDSIPIPQEVLDERDRLKAECNIKFGDYRLYLQTTNYKII